MSTISEWVISKIQKLRGSSFFPKYSKFNVDFKNAAKDSENFFCFWDNCIWICIVMLSLLTKRYFSSVAIVLISSPKISHVNNRDFFEHNFVPSDKWIWSRICEADLSSASACVPYFFWKHPLKRDFLDIYLTTFLESVTSKIQNLWGSSFFYKTFKI